MEKTIDSGKVGEMLTDSSSTTQVNEQLGNSYGWKEYMIENVSIYLSHVL